MHGLALEDIDVLLSVWARHARPVDCHFLWRPQLSDADDEMVLETAVNGSADAIVTRNRRDFAEAAGRFGLQLWSPAQLLAALRLRQR